MCTCRPGSAHSSDHSSDHSRAHPARASRRTRHGSLLRSHSTARPSSTMCRPQKSMHTLCRRLPYLPTYLPTYAHPLPTPGPSIRSTPGPSIRSTPGPSIRSTYRHPCRHPTKAIRRHDAFGAPLIPPLASPPCCVVCHVRAQVQDLVVERTPCGDGWASRTKWMRCTVCGTRRRSWAKRRADSPGGLARCTRIPMRHSRRQCCVLMRAGEE